MHSFFPCAPETRWKLGIVADEFPDPRVRASYRVPPAGKTRSHPMRSWSGGETRCAALGSRSQAPGGGLSWRNDWDHGPECGKLRCNGWAKASSFPYTTDQSLILKSRIRISTRCVRSRISAAPRSPATTRFASPGLISSDVTPSIECTGFPRAS